jgi:AbrB family looped-hinge helix DNA binding protein
MTIEQNSGMKTSNTATLTARFQISIPKAVREERKWKAGQEFAFIPKGPGILLIPVPEPDQLAGVAKGGQSRKTTATAKIAVDVSAYCGCEASVGAAFSASAFASLL